MKKIIMGLTLVVLSFSANTISLAQEYDGADRARGNASISIIESNDKDKPTSYDGSSYHEPSIENESKGNKSQRLPKTNDVKNTTYVFLGSIVLVVCCYILGKKHLKKEKI
ncbi:hypothetical protein [Vagococcus fessus]|uniref:Gram-positive cocci surface proteins LPxTG domain-containing protein n=1 Tax=Vagococcus fessus TaxID=120370 RepID=A0A430A860_9ENTE|nr:hypothetical protein [Vagococcus fessus]RSU03298.1 hypothetical protein CBF31_06175 [Vagococcus fessus]